MMWIECHLCYYSFWETHLSRNDGQIFFKHGIQNVRQNSAVGCYVYLHGETCRKIIMWLDIICSWWRLLSLVKWYTKWSFAFALIFLNFFFYLLNGHFLLVVLVLAFLVFPLFSLSFFSTKHVFVAIICVVSRDTVDLWSIQGRLWIDDAVKSRVYLYCTSVGPQLGTIRDYR